MNISLESLIIIAVIVAVVLFLGRALSYLLGVLVLGIAIVFGLALVSDLVTGGTALQQLAAKLAPAIAAIVAGGIGWFRQQTSNNP